MILNVVVLIILIIVIFYIRYNKKESFIKFSYNPLIQTPQTNYLAVTKKLEDQDKYKYDLSVALSPTPTVQCNKLETKTDCNNNGCNWFGTYCSAIYPSYL